MVTSEGRDVSKRGRRVGLRGFCHRRLSSGHKRVLPSVAVPFSFLVPNKPVFFWWILWRIILASRQRLVGNTNKLTPKYIVQ